MGKEIPLGKTKKTCLCLSIRFNFFQCCFVTGPGHQAGAVPHQRPDPVSLGFTQPDIKYEWNKLYILGLHFRSTRDAVNNYIERISGYDVKNVEMFKPNGKAIVTLNTDRIAGKW